MVTNPETTYFKPSCIAWRNLTNEDLYSIATKTESDIGLTSNDGIA